MKARTVCCGMLVDTDKAPKAKNKNVNEVYLVCDGCRNFIENASAEQLKEILTVKSQ